MKTFFQVVLLLCASVAVAQTDAAEALEEIRSFQSGLDTEFRDRKKSPLEPKDIKKFKGLPFFPADLTYRVRAKLTVTEGTPFLPMKTTTTRLAMDRIFGHVEFEIAGKQFRLPVYQSRDLLNNSEYTDYLFFPFTDLTNGEETYPGGRYIDLRIPKEGDSLVIDFNQAYNPLCAYSPRFSCPIVPAANHMDIEVRAGVKYVAKKKK